MKETKIMIKPLSVNEAWQGRRFKTEKYKAYIKELMFKLPKIKLPKPPYKIYFEFGFSNYSSDWDNPIKPFQDVLQLKYGFDDKEVLEARIVKKCKVPIGEEYIIYSIQSVNNKALTKYIFKV